MGNSESAPTEDVPVDRRSLYEQRSLVSFVEESDDDPLSSGDDWDHNLKIVPSSDENSSPNHDSARPNGGIKGTKLSSPTTGKSSHRVARDPEEDTSMDEIDDNDSHDESSEEEGYDDVESDDDDADSATSALMDASAAVFHYLTTTGVEDSGYTTATSEDVSIADRSAAVFDYLKQQASYGNEEPMRQFLQTAQAVSEVLRSEDTPTESPKAASRHYETKRMPKRNKGRHTVHEDEVSVSQQSAAIFQALDRARDDDDDPSDQHSATFPEWLETRSDPDEQSVVSEMSTTIFKVLDETKKKVNKESVAEFSAAVSTLLETKAFGEKRKGHKDEDDACSISERSAAIFKVLDRTKAPDVSSPSNRSTHSQLAKQDRQVQSTALPTSPRMADPILVGFLSHLKPKTDPAKLMQRNIFHILAQRAKTPTIPTIKEVENEEVEERDDHGATDNDEQPLRHLSNTAAVTKVYQQNETRAREESTPAFSPRGTRDEGTPVLPRKGTGHELTPALPPSGTREKSIPALLPPMGSSKVYLPRASQDVPSSEEEEASCNDEFMDPPVNMFSEVIHADSCDQEAHEQLEIQEDIDLNFVEHFDHAFNQFMGLYPKFLLNNPNLVHHLRITKLQKLLEYMDKCERDLVTEIDAVKDEKQKMISDYQYELKEASRRKAACQIQLQNQIGALNQRILMKQAQLTWRIVNSSEMRSKREYMFRQRQKKLGEEFLEGSLSGIPTRDEILELIPNDNEGIKLENAIFAPPRFMNSKDNDEINQLRQFQVDNAFMSSEIAVLQKKLLHSQANWKRLAWVETILMRMDKVQMAKLKKKYAHKQGVTSFE